LGIHMLGGVYSGELFITKVLSKSVGKPGQNPTTGHVAWLMLLEMT